MSEKDGGPAFPGSKAHGTNQGMTLRDYFAATAMRGLFDMPAFEDQWNVIAKDAYAMADAMLAERTK